MTPYYSEDGITLYHGSCLDVLRALPDESVNCCITSPPYWGLRTYGTDPQVWGGDSMCEHAWEDASYRDSRKTDTTAGVKQRTNNGATGWRDELRQNATCSRCGSWSGEIGLEPIPEMFVEHLVLVFSEVRRVLRGDGTLWLNLGDSYAANRGYQVPDGKFKDVGNSKGAAVPDGLKPKDLVGIPWRVAFALQSNGWWLRSDIIWAKPAPMPESVTDRPTRSHEYIFLLSKSEKYYYDHQAIKEPSVSDHGSGNGYRRDSRLTYTDDNGARGSDKPWVPSRPSAKKGSFNGKTEAMADTGQNAFRAMTEFRNKRDVWTVGSDPFPEAHFATFPPALILPCVLAGCPIDGVVLDPFNGAGTTAMVAKDNGRKAIGSDLNAEYLEMSARRLSQGVLAFA